ncbi:MAG: CBS domain-containing protein [Saprospiraceae bacterium]|nr:CBS domain-containing protein [Saprospiraceae bacterium]
MSTGTIQQLISSDGKKNFLKCLMKDLRAMHYMLENDWFETDITRIGAEQEMVLVDRESYRPACIAPEVLAKTTHLPYLGGELARFNLESNLDPLVFEKDCFSVMHKELKHQISTIDQILEEFNARIVLTGILPTLQKKDLKIENLTPKDRYYALVDSINRELKGNAYELRLSGIDELMIRHDSPLLEACNTSFQVHLQVSPAEFSKMYNMALALTGPVLAISANSSLVFGRRLWHENRIALFQQSIDTRTSHDHLREKSPRVNFGNDWAHNSIMDIYREDIARFNVLMGFEIDEDSIEKVKDKVVPELYALRMHNSTVYRWNRPCYGISDTGKPHLRIENRVIPSGPTIIDEVANAAFWLGAMKGMDLAYDDMRRYMSYEDVRDNFFKAATHGVDSKFNWCGDSKISACDLILQEILPLAKSGLKHMKINESDIDTYMGVIEERAKKHTNGARWCLRAFTALKKISSSDEALTTLTATMVENQNMDTPVSEWPMPSLIRTDKYQPIHMRIEQFMETDLITVRKDDIIDLVAEIMDWKRVRYLPVEDTNGQLVGLMTSRRVLRYYAHEKINELPVAVEDIMIKDPVHVNPDQTIQEALELMKANNIGGLPVAKNGELIGFVTEIQLLRILSKYS